MKISVITPTHDPAYLQSAHASLLGQTHEDWEWLISVNDPKGRFLELQKRENEIQEFVQKGNRVVPFDTEKRTRVFIDSAEGQSVGMRKESAFSHARGDVVLELDHDDVLTPNALAEVAKAFEDSTVDFVYSDWADFETFGSKTLANYNHPVNPQGNATYRNPNTRPGWLANNFKFYKERLEGQGFTAGEYECVRSFAPSAIAFSSIYWAPNHLRAWRRFFYRDIGGHNPHYNICDDHELLCRTYLQARNIVHIPKPLYLYRVSDSNTWSGKVEEIKAKTALLGEEYIERLAQRQATIADMKALDLGGLHGMPEPPEDPFLAQRLTRWIPVDIESRVRGMGGIEANLNLRWPFADSSIGVIRAHDFLEHLKDKTHTMNEIHRILMPGGILLSLTPSTDGRGAFMDPNHISYWNQNAFWYWTRKQQANYLNSDSPTRFQELLLKTFFPSPWHEQHDIPYVRAVLVALKDGYDGPGEKLI